MKGGEEEGGGGADEDDEIDQYSVDKVGEVARPW